MKKDTLILNFSRETAKVSFKTNAKAVCCGVLGEGLELGHKTRLPLQTKDTALTRQLAPPLYQGAEKHQSTNENSSMLMRANII